MKEITIRDIKTFITAPQNINLVVVKVETSEPELYGIGCATFTWRCKTVVTAVEEYLKPMLLGKSVHNIEDIWQSMMGSSYWRGGPVLNNALSGVDEALWDIKASLPTCPSTVCSAASAGRESLYTAMRTEPPWNRWRIRSMNIWNRATVTSDAIWVCTEAMQAAVCRP